MLTLIQNGNGVGNVFGSGNTVSPSTELPDVNLPALPDLPDVNFSPTVK
jgi:hypothetical protein